MTILRVNYALRSSEEYLSTLLFSIGDAVIATNASGRVEFMNPVAETLTGWNIREAKGMPLSDCYTIINTLTRKPVENPVAEVMEKGMVVGLANHTSLIAKDGTEYHIADSAAPIRLDKGPVQGVVMVFRDITDEYHALEERKLRHRYETALSGISRSLLMEIEEDRPIGAALEHLRTATGFAEVSMYEIHEDAGKRQIRKVYAGMDPDIPDNERPSFLLYQQIDEIPDIWWKNIMAGGHELVYADNCAKEEKAFLEKRNINALLLLPLRMETTTPAIIAAVQKENRKMQDEKTLRLFKTAAILICTYLGRKETEKKLSEANSIIRKSPAMVFSWINAPGFPVDFVSENIISVLGYSPKEFLGREVAYMDIVHPEDRNRVAEEVKEVITSQDIEEFTHAPYRVVRKTGETIWVDDSTVATRDEEGKITGFKGVVIDITWRMLAEKEKEKMEEQLKTAQKIESIGRLAGGIAHDFNNMLSPIIGYGEMLNEMYAHNPDAKEMAEQILYAAQRAKELVRRILAFGRKQTLALAPIDLRDTIQHMEPLLQKSLREDILFRVHLPDTPCMVNADQGQLEQVLLNLTLNARDAMAGKGTLTIECSLAELDEAHCDFHTDIPPGRYVLLTVSDTGAGMDGKLQERIFDPFFSTKGEAGTGLGLSTAHGIVKQHRGNLLIYSEPGKGTTAKVYLPCIEKLPGEIQAPRVEKGGLKGDETILLAEDDPSVRKLTKNILTFHNYRVLEAKDGSQALTLAEEDPHRAIHLLVTDLVMPDMNGKILFEKIKKSRPDIRVLYMSGYADNVISHQGVLMEKVSLIQKPFSVNQLAEKVREVLDAEPRE